MGRFQNLSIRYALIAALALGGSAQVKTAQAKSQRAAQTYPIMSLQTPLARDADTFSDDKTLVRACTAEGETSATCLCVTHVLKYELTLNEYRAAVRLYGSDAPVETVAAALRPNGVTAADIGTAREILRGLTQTNDFKARCAEAKAYYKPASR